MLKFVLLFFVLSLDIINKFNFLHYQVFPKYPKFVYGKSFSHQVICILFNHCGSVPGPVVHSVSSFAPPPTGLVQMHNKIAPF